MQGWILQFLVPEGNSQKGCPTGP